MDDKKNKFTLIENAKDSLEHAVEHLTKNTEVKAKDIKRVILDVAHAVELLLKERLNKIHPAFIWENIDQYPSPEARLVGTHKAIARLCSLGGIIIPSDSIGILSNCRKIRNKIEHCEFEIEPRGTRIIIGRMLSFIFDFSKRHLDLDWESDFKRNRKWAKLIKMYDEFYKAHKDVVKKRLEEQDTPSCECPFCNASTFDLSAMKCDLCGHCEELAKCHNCKEFFPESEMQVTQEVSGHDEDDIQVCDVELCHECFEYIYSRDDY